MDSAMINSPSRTTMRRLSATTGEAEDNPTPTPVREQALRQTAVSSGRGISTFAYFLDVKQSHFKKVYRAKTAAKQNPKFEYRNPKQT